MSLHAQFSTERFLKKLDHLDTGTIHLILPNGKEYDFGGRDAGPEATLTLHDWRVLPRMLVKGDIGFAADYRDGKWETDNLQALLEIGLLNQRSLEQLIMGKMLTRLASRFTYLFRKNSLQGSRENIQAHYDLGNDFYALWLDESMTYSSALYATPEDHLRLAQSQKYNRIIDRLNGESGHLLEIGCGWGGFAEEAAGRGDFAIKGITLSDEQKAYAEKRLGTKAHIALEDYRHQQGTFDHIVSIEMFEAVGETYWPVYFGQVGRLLKRGGKAVIQTITIAEEYFENYRRSGDFIRHFIFPGGMLPSVERFDREAERSGLKAHEHYFFGNDYARTLETWRTNFMGKAEQVKAMGFDEPFIRMWEFYLAACAAGFKTGRINVMQVGLQHD
ncbi:MAG: class I SAM-dependent methyltransferase [Pseudobdellovibrionaceae bacterium]